MLDLLEELGFRFRLNEKKNLEWRCINDGIRPETAQKIVSSLNVEKCIRELENAPSGFILASGRDEISAQAKRILTALESGELNDVSVMRFSGPEILFTFQPAGWRAAE